MLLKLCMRNIRRSVKDYAIYFVTLVFGVAVFYAFNSISSQQILFEIEQTAGENIFDLMDGIMSLFSVVVACALGFLIVYANRFLIKRRKHEFGIYLTLGMTHGQVSRIVLCETALVGLASLAVGLAIGIALSQALSFATAALFSMAMTQYQFIFSTQACASTLACFIAIFVVVALFNLLSIRNYKLIDLLTAQSKNEKAPVRNPWICLAAFIASIGILAAAYYFLNKNGLIFMLDADFNIATVLMLVGTFLFFWSLAGFLIAVLQRSRGVYLRGLNLFTIRQIASKINTAFISLWAVCVMLFLAISTYSVGMGLLDVFTGNIERSTPYDMTISSVFGVNPDIETNEGRAQEIASAAPEMYAKAQKSNFDALSVLEKSVPNWNKLVKDSAEIDVYQNAGTTYAQLFDKAGIEHAESESEMSNLNHVLSETEVTMISQQQFNDAMALAGGSRLDLKADEYAVANTLNYCADIAATLVDNNTVFDIENAQLKPVDSVLEVNLQTSALDTCGMMMVVPDAIIESLVDNGAIPSETYVNVMYHTPGTKTDAQLRDALQSFNDDWTEEIGTGAEWWPAIAHYEKADLANQNTGLRMMITYLALYIGLVLLITTAAILAIQQLSETADSTQRYKLLAKLGCDQRTLNKSLLAQIVTYFLAPLALAACHTACVICVLSGSLFEAFGISSAGAIVSACMLVVVIYGIYMAVTYFASRSIIKQTAK